MSVMRSKLERAMDPIATALDHALPRLVGCRERVGFVVMVFELNKPDGYLAYVSNANRDDMIRALEEWLARAKAGLMTDPPGPRAES